MTAITAGAVIAQPSIAHRPLTKDTPCRVVRAAHAVRVMHGQTFSFRPAGALRPVRGGVTIRANWNDNTDVKDRAERAAEKTQAKKDNEIIAGGVVVLMAAALLAVTVGQDAIEDVMYGTGLWSLGAFGSGDVVGALLWSFSLWFCSPLQLLFLFLGAIDTERPSDWLILQFGKLTGQPLDAVDYSAPLGLRVAAGGTCVLAGLAIAAALELSLGDATWSVSTGIGSILVSGIYEVGRPNRLSAEEAEELQSKWEDFAVFADSRLQRGGRCHETEVFTAFRKSNARYRDPETVTDTVLKDMVRNWHPGVQRTASGYYKNLSVIPVADPFQ